MVTIGLLLGFLIVTTWTDIRDGKIYNWATYPGILIGIVWNLASSLIAFSDRWGEAFVYKWLGTVGVGESLLGFFACGGAMLVCYVFFAGQVGGGDIKLIAMIGAFLGVMEGLEAMLWSFVIAAAVAIVRLIWQMGIVTCLRMLAGTFMALVRFRKLPTANEDDGDTEEKNPMKAALCLSPSALAAVVVVKIDDLPLWLN